MTTYARRSALFKQADLTRAVKALQRAGLAVSGAEIDQAGKIVILTGRRSEETEARTASDVVAQRIAEIGAKGGKR